MYDTLAAWEAAVAIAQLHSGALQVRGLATAGPLDDRDHTSNAPAFLAQSGYAGAHRCRDQPAVTHGDLVTATGVAPVDFAQANFTRLDQARPVRRGSRCAGTRRRGR